MCKIKFRLIIIFFFLNSLGVWGFKFIVVYVDVVFDGGWIYNN